ncbi:MAG: chemotaxis protein CheD [Elusimicrobiota bacterium]
MLTVGVGDFAFSDNLNEEIITYALGSCVGVTFYDPVLKKGALLHAMLPACSDHKEKCDKNPYMFVDSGMDLVLKKMLNEGCDKKRLIICACGGASPTARNKEDFFQIGMKNVASLRKFMWQNGMVLKSSDFGGYDSRTVILNLNCGRVIMKTQLKTINLFNGVDLQCEKV